MKYRNLLMTSIGLAVLVAVVNLCAPAICQTPGLIPTGNCSLPPGQYMLTNMRTGLAVYLEIDSSGRLLAQDPKALQFSVAPIGTVYGSNTYGQTQTPPVTTGGATPGTGTAFDTTQKPSMWGGLLKQGVQSILNNKTAPGTTATPTQ